jgi:hypothetical protein
MSREKIIIFFIKLLAWNIVFLLLFLLKYAHEYEYAGFLGTVLPKAFKAAVYMGTCAAVLMELWTFGYKKFQEKGKKNGE